MLSAFDNLQLDRMFLIYNGHRELLLNENIMAVPAHIHHENVHVDQTCHGPRLSLLWSEF